jgi:hypothetical protein
VTSAVTDRQAGDEGGSVPVDFERFLLLLGRLNYSWTNTESVLIHMIAGLARTDKDTAVVLFLTLNTTRARVDLVERLAKLDRVSEAERDGVLRLTRQMLRLAGMRNTYNHCIYAFDQRSGDLSTIRMRVADRRNAIKVGEMTSLDTETLDRIEESLKDLARLNTDFWGHIMRYGYPV